MDQEDISEVDETSVQVVRPSGGVTGRKRKMVLFNLALVNFVVCINFAILAPFFPEEAANKGVSAAVIGFIFGEFELIIFLTAPVFGILLPRIGAKFMYTAGIFLTGMCTILFGFLGDCPPGTIFIVMTLLVRGLMAIGASMLVTASFAIIAVSFPDNVTTMFGLLETFSGIGLMIGPPVGGALYQLGGFVTPFAVLGGLLVVVVPVTMVVLDFNSDNLPSQTGSILTLLRNPHIVLACVGLVGSSVTIGFEDPILQKFLFDNFQLNHLLVGIVFLVGPAIYAVLSPVTGHLCDKKDVTKPCIAFSLLMTGFSMLLLNPSPLLNIGPPKLWITIVALIVFGFGVGFAFAPATKDVLNECLFMGFQDNFGTFSLVSGLINSVISLGFFAGPMLSGVLTQNYGFAWSTTYLGFGLLGVGVLYLLYTVIFLCCCGGRHRILPNSNGVESLGEREPLLSSR